jgi:hypothetical protein
VAADLNDPTSWHWLSSDDWVIEGAVRGAGEGAVRHTRTPAVETNDPYRVYRLVEALDLPPEASLGTYHHRAGQIWKQEDPVVDIVGYLTNAMRDFNGTQQPRKIRLEADELTEALLAARKLALTDAQTLVETLPVLGQRVQPPVPEALYMVLVRTDPTKGLFYGEYVQAHYGTIRSESSEEEVHVAIIDSLNNIVTRGGEAPDEFFRRRWNTVMQAGFGIDGAADVHTAGEAQGVLAHLLGYEDRDIRVVRVDETGEEQPI